MLPFKEIVETAWHILEFPLFGFAVWTATSEYRERLTDWRGKRKGKEYRIKRTYIKDVIREEYTERIKLRLLRVTKNTKTLSIDPMPVRDPNRTPVNTSNLYSIPGSASINPEGKIAMLFAEPLEPHEDHVVLVGYTMKETIRALHEPPGVWAVQPVGRHLVYEAHFPANWHYQRISDEDDTPKVRVYTKGRSGEVELDHKKFTAVGGCFNFDDGQGIVDYLQVTINSPPQNDAVHIAWFWQSAKEE